MTRAMAVAILWLATVASAAEPRKWTDASGKFAIEGEMVKVADGKVTLRRPSGELVTVPIEALSAADQAFLRTRTRAPAATGPKPFRGRSDAKLKAGLLKGHGGSEETEAAVGAALEWLKRQQADDGMWSLKGPYDDAAIVENQLAATAMAVLAFQGSGSTHLNGKYRSQVAQAKDALLKRMDTKGAVDLQGASPPHHRMYTQAQATLALCELYGMTGDASLRPAAQRLVDYAVKSQSPEGGWRYRPGMDADTSVTGWFVRALHTGKTAGLNVPQRTLGRVTAYLDKAGLKGGAQYAYQPGQRATLAMTAEGLLCRQHLGWGRDHASLLDGVSYLRENVVDRSQHDGYYWHHATQLMFHMGGNDWRQWNSKLRNTLIPAQSTVGPETGSWPPNDDKWGNHGGRLYVTCLNTYMLQVYYRNSPLYKAP